MDQRQKLPLQFHFPRLVPKSPMQRILILHGLLVLLREGSSLVLGGLQVGDE